MSRSSSVQNDLAVGEQKRRCQNIECCGIGSNCSLDRRRELCGVGYPMNSEFDLAIACSALQGLEMLKCRCGGVRKHSYAAYSRHGLDQELLSFPVKVGSKQTEAGRVAVGPG